MYSETVEGNVVRRHTKGILEEETALESESRDAILLHKPNMKFLNIRASKVRNESSTIKRRSRI